MPTKHIIPLMKFIMFSTVTLFLFGLAFPASAIPPTKEPSPLEAFTIMGTCSFDVFLDPLTNREKIATFYDQNGNVRFQIITGSLKVRLTNTSTGKSVDLNISGPIQQVPQPDGSLKVINLGSTLFLFSPGVAPGLPLLAHTDGRAESKYDAQGNFQFLSLRGTVDDVCSLL